MNSIISENKEERLEDVALEQFTEEELLAMSEKAAYPNLDKYKVLVKYCFYQCLSFLGLG